MRFSLSKTVKYISITKMFQKVIGVGIYIGWGKRSLVLIIQLFGYVLVLGPHYKDGAGNTRNVK